MLLSILIPTKNHADYIESAVKGFLSFDKKITRDAEIVIVDNSVEENTHLKNISSKNIFYDWESSDLSMIENFDRAIKLARGKYICIIGDDDFFLPSIFEVAKLLDFNSIDSAMAELSPYYWPGVHTHWLKDNNRGTLEIAQKQVTPSSYNVKDGLNKVLSSGGTKYINILPSAYHGMVKKSILVSFINKYGTAFPGPSPDISNAVLLAIHGVSCYKVESFVISGAGIGSGAAEGAAHAHHGRLSDRKGFVKKIESFWPDNIPKFFCGPTMWAVSVINTLKFSGHAHLIKKLNLNFLHAACFVYHRQYSEEIFESLGKQTGSKTLKFLTGGVVLFFERVVQYFYSFLKYYKCFNILSNWTVIKGVQDTSEIVEHVRK